MASLFNIDIDQIKHNGNEVLLMKLNGDIVYEKDTFRIEYTVYPEDVYLNHTDYEGKCCMGLPRIYRDATNYSFNGYSKITITKTDGTTTTNPRTKCNEIKKVTITFPENTYGISFYYPYTSDVTAPVIKEVLYCNTFSFSSAASMFYDCYITNINNMNKWKTRNITDMSSMFYNCGNLITLDVSNFNTSNVSKMSHMFSGCYSLQSLDVSNFDTSSVTYMNYMFENCNDLTSLDVSNFDTSNVCGMFGMFRDCKNLATLDLSNFNTSKVTEPGHMFYGCESLTELNLSNFKFVEGTLISTPGYMFYNCNSLHTLRLDNCDNYTLKMIINYGDLPSNIIEGVTKTIYCKASQMTGVNKRPAGWVYSYIEETEEPEVPDVPEEPETPDEPTVPYMEYTVADVYDSKMLGEKYYDKDTGADGCYGLPRIYTNASNYSYTGYDDIEIILKDDTIANKPSYVSIAETSKVKIWFPENTYSIKFSPNYKTSYGYSETSCVNNLTYINYSSGVTDMSYMFQYCIYLTKCNFDCDTSNVTDMSGMFHSCQLLSSLDLSGFNTSNVTNMSGMFNSCTSLATLDLSGWNTNNVTRMDYMFQYCSSLTDLNLSSFDISRTTNVYNMFYSCSNLTNLDAPRNISASISFSSCKNLTHDSLMSIINNLATISGKTLTLGETNLAKLSEEEKAIATNKGWTLI